MSDINKLVEIGLTNYEAKAYCMMIGVEHATAGEIATNSKIPRSKIYEVLEGLILKGFCTEISGPVKKFKAANPKFALNYFRSELESRKANLELTEHFLMTSFDTLQRDKTPLNFIEVIFNKNGLIEKVDQLIPITQNSILSFSKPPYMITEQDPDWQIQQKNSHKAELINKTVYQIEYDRADDFLRMARKSEQDGEQVRLIDDLPMKFFIFDENYVIFLMANEQENQPKLGFLAIKNTELAKTLKKVFELYWDQGISIDKFEEEYIKKRHK